MNDVGGVESSELADWEGGEFTLQRNEFDTP